MADQNVSKVGVKLVLNGGKEILDSATVPVRWHLSEEVIAMKPRYILIADHDASLDEFRKTPEFCQGYRTWFAVRELAGYIQIHKPGRHHFIAIVFCGDEDAALMDLRRYLTKSEPRFYDISLYWDNVSEKIGAGFSAVAEFEVPSELFAKKPETRFSQWVWRWVNRWYETNPVDECSYRRRKIFAFTLQPVLLGVWRLLSGVIGSLYTIIGSFVILFFGFRPLPVLKNIRDSWTNPEEFEDNLSRFRKHSYSWRIWEWSGYYDDHKKIPVPLVPFILVLEVAGVYLLYLAVRKWPVLFMIVGAWILWVVICIGAILLVIYLGYKVILLIASRVSKVGKSRFWKERQEKIEKAKREREERRKEVGAKKELKRFETRERQRITEEKRYQNFLLENVDSINNPPATVNIPGIIRKVDTITKFRLSYHMLKAKVCRPFPKG